MTSAPRSQRPTAYRPSRRRRSSFAAWLRARPNTSSRSGPRIEMQPPLKRCALSGHVFRRGMSVLANRIRAPKDMGEVVDIIRRLPTYIRLVWALLRDGRVPAQQKLILAGIGAYLFFPIDLIPDFVPVLGQLDDLAVVLLGLDLFIRSAPPDIVEEHLAKISQDQDQLRRDIATAERVLGDRVGLVRDTVEKLRTRDLKTTGRKRGST